MPPALNAFVASQGTWDKIPTPRPGPLALWFLSHLACPFVSQPPSLGAATGPDAGCFFGPSQLHKLNKSDLFYNLSVSFIPHNYSQSVINALNYLVNHLLSLPGYRIPKADLVDTN